MKDRTALSTLFKYLFFILLVFGVGIELLAFFTDVTDWKNYSFLIFAGLFAYSATKVWNEIHR